jgi:Spy/CpxP family protein refolding chaperone
MPGGVVISAAMARVIVWTCAALLFAGTTARAAVVCEWSEQRPGGQAYSQSDKRDKPPAGREGPKKWWVDAQWRADLGLSDQQSATIEQVWQRSLAQRAETRDRLEKLDAVLQKMILDAADESAVTAQLDRVEAARSEANKARVIMLYRMNKVLTQEQRAKLDAKVKAMRERDGRRGPGLH